MGKKRALYSKHGVTEYWLVDPMAEAVEIHRLQGDILIPSRTFGRNETLRSELFPGLEINLDEVFLVVRTAPDTRHSDKRPRR